MNRIIPHVHRAWPLNGFENGPNLAENTVEYVLVAENTIQYVLVVKWNRNSTFSSANPGSQKLPSNGFTEWNFLGKKERAYQNRE